MVEFFVDESTGVMLVGVRIQFDLLLVIHEDTATTFNIRSIAGCSPCKPLWQGEELRSKLQQWDAVMQAKLRLGMEAYLKGAR